MKLMDYKLFSPMSIQCDAPNKNKLRCKFKAKYTDDTTNVCSRHFYYLRKCYFTDCMNKCSSSDGFCAVHNKTVLSLYKAYKNEKQLLHYCILRPNSIQSVYFSYYSFQLLMEHNILNSQTYRRIRLNYRSSATRQTVETYDLETLKLYKQIVRQRSHIVSLSLPSRVNDCRSYVSYETMKIAKMPYYPTQRTCNKEECSCSFHTEGIFEYLQFGDEDMHDRYKEYINYVREIFPKELEDSENELYQKYYIVRQKTIYY